MGVRAVLIAVLWVSGLAHAQTILSPARVQRLLPMLDPSPDDRPMQCDVTPLKPLLNYGFRFQAGYAVQAPMNQYLGSGHSIAILAAITPDGSDRPVYLGSRFGLPEIPRSKNELSFGGAYLLGEGGYSVKWTMMDETGRVCRKKWHVDVKLSRGERGVHVAIPRGTVSDLAGRGLRRARRGSA